MIENTEWSDWEKTFFCQTVHLLPIGQNLKLNLFSEHRRYMYFHRSAIIIIGLRISLIDDRFVFSIMLLFVFFNLHSKILSTEQQLELSSFHTDFMFVQR